MVAVIVPVYDDARRLAGCLRALEEQTYPADRYQVLVVDNGSGEDIAGVCRAFPRVRCVSEPRPGSYAARNKGIACTEGEFLAFTDSDC
ncbi:glycosyltransferase, partial [Natronospira sp.]|uniref:glycosyltransferase n=1 Tax=Natronospira sp. TaxID=2024970 RepID=UPI003873AFBD